MVISRLSTRVFCLAALAVAPAAAASIAIRVLPSVSPDAYYSPSFPEYVSNAMYAIRFGLTAYGTPGTPAYYQQTSVITPDQMVVTSFNSWMGLADPGTFFGPAFAGEYGNRPLFGVDIKGMGSKISIGQLGFSGISDDPGGLLNLSWPPGSYDYSTDYMGIVYGPDGITYITSGPNTQLVDEIVGRGSGNADTAYCDFCSTEQQQATIDALSSDFAGMTSFTGTYTMSDLNGDLLGSATGSFIVVPEPATTLLVGGSLIGLGIFLRRRR
jgi:hypothetical protein